MKQLLQNFMYPIAMIYLLGGVLFVGCDSDSSADDSDDSSDDSSADSSGDETDNSNGSDSATINLDVAPCIATFTESYDVIDFWGDVEHTIQAGESLIIKEFDSVFGETNVYYLDAAGPFEMTIEPNDVGEFPYETDCTESNSSSYTGVFADTTIYADEELSTVLCTVPKGKALPSSSYGYFLVGDAENGGSVYGMTSNAIIEECGGESGYVVTPEVEVWPDYVSWLIPIQLYLAKNQ